MSAATVTRTRVSGFDAIVLENAHIRAVILPSLGGRVWELVDRARDRQWIWHRHDVPLAEAAPGASYDDVWAGGWEELFPNDAPGEFEGRMLPDHGSWWTAAWTVVEEGSGSEAFVRLATETRAPNARSVKEFRLASNASTLRVSYQITSQEDRAFHFLFKQHLPIALTPACRLALPGGRVTAVDPTFGTMLNTGDAFSWPVLRRAGGADVDLSRVPPSSSALREFVYVSGLPQAWCGVDDTERGASIRMHYDAGAVPYAWLFLTYGGWRDCYTAVLEPCTNMPKDLASAARAGQSAVLRARGVFETQVSVTVDALSGTR